MKTLLLSLALLAAPPPVTDAFSQMKAGMATCFQIGFELEHARLQPQDFKPGSYEKMRDKAEAVCYVKEQR